MVAVSLLMFAAEEEDVCEALDEDCDDEEEEGECDPSCA